jgi:SAM-dependent methyltransferase
MTLMTGKLRNALRRLIMRVMPHLQSEIEELRSAIKLINILRFNTKTLGYQLAQTLQPRLTSADLSKEPANYGLVSKAVTQADLEAPWFGYWCSELKETPRYHRKLWECAFVLQGLFERNLLDRGSEGIGFGCGKEPLASYFASKKMSVTVTDVDPAKVRDQGWIETGQHTSSKEDAFYPDIVSPDLFDRYVHHRYIDMNNIPAVEKHFDFCWSMCALEHLGSIQNGLEFIKNSLSVLKPGGVAIHTTEFNYFAQDDTIDNGPTVLFLRKHFENLFRQLAADGHQFLGPDFDVGDGMLDRFIDIPPYSFGEHNWFSREQWDNVNHSAHLKLAIDRFACTSFGLIVIKRE